VAADTLEGGFWAILLVRPPRRLTYSTQGLLTEEFFYIGMQYMVKMCFLLFYFRLSDAPWFRRALLAVIGFHTATTIVIWLLYGFQCRPLAAFYDPASYPHVKCLGINMYVAFLSPN
jgi:hypothetical protein